VKADALKSACPKGRETELILESTELSFHGGAAAVEALPLNANPS
jgi:hypothetical protein